ncbi:unnamed protein product [Malus baccata var. baccata]
MSASESMEFKDTKLTLGFPVAAARRNVGLWRPLIRFAYRKALPATVHLAVHYQVVVRQLLSPSSKPQLQKQE